MMYSVMGIPFSLGLLLLAFMVSTECSTNSADYNVLQAFKGSADSGNRLGSWENGDPCSGGWYGVRCRNHSVVRLVLQHLGLTGPIDSLMDLNELRVLSLRGNSLNGSIPRLSNWGSLRLLFLSYNQFSGPLPSTISSPRRLWRLDVSNNNLSGHIPSSLNSLSHLLTLRLENNLFSGSISELNLTSLQDLNLSGNRLAGAIPRSLSRFPSSAFAGNAGLCGSPLSRCTGGGRGNTDKPSSPSGPLMQPPSIVPSTPGQRPNTMTPSNKSSAKLSRKAVIAIVLGDFAFLVLIISILLFHYWRRYGRKTTDGKPKKGFESQKAAHPSSHYLRSSSSADRGKLVFIESGRHFELEDLLRASAEMLGKGTFGSAYKAALEDCSVVVVKRLKDPNPSGRRDFEQHMELLGRLRHPNLVSLKAYYCSKDEKLLVYDFLPNGSLYSLLHGNRGPGRTPLDWNTRVKIVLDAARGLAFIHESCKSPKIAHGNVKSSNVLLDNGGNGCLSDFGLTVVVGPSATGASRMAAYRAPEQAERKRLSQKADVYSFGVLLLEILTGKDPFQCHVQEGEGMDLPKWVLSVVREEWTAEVFDLELMRYKNIEEELVAMLQIALLCVSPASKQRPKMGHVVRMIEDIQGEHCSPLQDSISQSSPSEDAASHRSQYS